MAIIDLKNPGWCTPTLLVVIFGVLVTLALLIQLVTYKPTRLGENGRQAILISILTKVAWTILIAGILYWLCRNGRLEAAWWVFGILYILPVALMLVLLLVGVNRTGL